MIKVDVKFPEALEEQFREPMLVLSLRTINMAKKYPSLKMPSTIFQCLHIYSLSAYKICIP